MRIWKLSWGYKMQSLTGILIRKLRFWFKSSQTSLNCQDKLKSPVSQIKYFIEIMWYGEKQNNYIFKLLTSTYDYNLQSQFYSVSVIFFIDEFLLDTAEFILGGLGSLAASDVSIPLSPSSALLKVSWWFVIIYQLYYDIVTFCCHFSLLTTSILIQGVLSP